MTNVKYQTSLNNQYHIYKKHEQQRLLNENNEFSKRITKMYIIFIKLI
jgi:hypothetical protein